MTTMRSTGMCPSPSVRRFAVVRIVSANSPPEGSRNMSEMPPGGVGSGIDTGIQFSNDRLTSEYRKSTTPITTAVAIIALRTRRRVSSFILLLVGSSHNDGRAIGVFKFPLLLLVERSFVFVI